MDNAKTIISELEQHSPELAAKPRWIVFNKLDLLLEEAKEVTDRVLEGLAWEGNVQSISAFTKTGTEKLCYNVMDFIDALPKEDEEKIIDGKSVEFKWDTYHEDTISELDDNLDDEEWDEDEYDVEVEYRK